MSTELKEKPKRKKDKTVKEQKSKKRERTEFHEDSNADDVAQTSGNGRSKRRKQQENVEAAEPSEAQVLTKMTRETLHLESRSPFLQQTASFYLPLSPCAYRFPLEGLCAEHISPLELTYYPPLRAVVLGYSNAVLSERAPVGGESNASETDDIVLSESVNEYAVSFAWLTAKFLLFRPQRGTWLEGYVNLQNESLLGVLCYNYFNAAIERKCLPKDWTWLAEEEQQEEVTTGDILVRKGKNGTAVHGHFADGLGKKVEGRIVFRVEDFETTQGSDLGIGGISIYGSLLTEAAAE